MSRKVNRREFVKAGAVAGVAVGVVAALAGPLLAAFGDGGDPNALLTPGVVALGLAGVATNALRTWATRSLVSSFR